MEDLQNHVEGGVLGGTIVAGGAFLLRFLNSLRKNDRADLVSRFALMEQERKDLLSAQTQLRQELLAQILDLRKQVLDLVERNSEYAAENISLRAKIAELEHINGAFEIKVCEMQREIDSLLQKR